MSTTATVPIFGPDGKAYDIPYENMHDALSQGGKMGVYVQGPDQKQYVIPADRTNDAIKAGGKVVPYNLDASHQKEGFWKAAASTVGGLAEGMVGTVANAARGNVAGMAASTGTQMGIDELARRQDNRSLPYRVVAGAGGALGIDARGMEQAANAGDAAGVLGHAAGSAAPLAAGEALKATVPRAATAAKTAFLDRSTAAVRATVPEAAQMPPQAIFGAEKIYRAAAPTGGDPQFRGQLYKAAGDLAEIGQKNNVAESAGGTIQPDMRVRATVNAINDHLSEMYQNERVPQIQRNASNPVQTNFGEDASDGLAYMARRSGKAIGRSLAAKALSNDYLTLAETDQLARIVNKDLLGFQSMTPAERAAASSTNRRLGALESLDHELGDKIATELQNRGEPGIQQYEQRYAALSSIRDQLQKRINATELERTNPIGRFVRGAVGGKSGIASASQAAVADVSIGRQLQDGLNSLAQSGIKANRGISGTTVPIRGLLPVRAGSPFAMPAADLTQGR